jgi:hypothetical protein
VAEQDLSQPALRHQLKRSSELYHSALNEFTAALDAQLEASAARRARRAAAT